jgi:hypothetical protein
MASARQTGFSNPTNKKRNIKVGHRRPNQVVENIRQFAVLSPVFGVFHSPYIRLFTASL